MNTVFKTYLEFRYCLNIPNWSHSCLERSDMGQPCDFQRRSRGSWRNCSVMMVNMRGPFESRTRSISRTWNMEQEKAWKVGKNKAGSNWVFWTLPWRGILSEECVCEDLYPESTQCLFVSEGFSWFTISEKHSRKVGILGNRIFQSKAIRDTALTV